MIDLTPIMEAIVALVAAVITAFVIPWLKGKIDADKLDSKADHAFYLVKKGDPFYSNQQKFEVSFYDIDSNSYEQKTTILRAEDSFVNDEGIYYIKTENKRLANAIEQNGKTYRYDCNATLYEYVFETGETKEITLDSMKSTANFSGFINALGVDKKGRIYVANASDDLCLYDTLCHRLSSRYECGM